MDNLAPAISPPGGLGDSKPTNQAVLDWVQEVARLTEPENIFWCDGSEAENEFLISESLKQNVLFKLNEAKLAGALGTPTFRPAEAAEIFEALGAHPGSLGAVAVTKLPVYADEPCGWNSGNRQRMLRGKSDLSADAAALSALSTQRDQFIDSVSYFRSQIR